MTIPSKTKYTFAGVPMSIESKYIGKGFSPWSRAKDQKYQDEYHLKFSGPGKGKKGEPIITAVWIRPPHGYKLGEYGQHDKAIASLMGLIEEAMDFRGGVEAFVSKITKGMSRRKSCMSSTAAEGVMDGIRRWGRRRFELAMESYREQTFRVSVPKARAKASDSTSVKTFDYNTIKNRSDVISLFNYNDRWDNLNLSLQGTRLSMKRKTKIIVEKKINDPHIILDPPVDFTYTTKEGKRERFFVGYSTLFTHTSKMGCMSFSIPAGPMDVGGSCPASKLGLNASTEAVTSGNGGYNRVAMIASDGFEKSSRVNRSTFDYDEDNGKFICAFCYAGKGMYNMHTTQLPQVARMTWVNKILNAGSLSRKDGARISGGRLIVDNEGEIFELGERIVDAIKRTLRLKSKKDRDNRYFRIHDSGDFYRMDYYLAWVHVIKKMPKIKFWAPTRQWALKGWIKLFNSSAGRPPSNFSLRPSALQFEAPSPMIQGVAAGTTGSLQNAIRNRLADWDCPAYRHSGHSCQDACGPTGQKDCRYCWMNRNGSVSYRAH